MLKPATGLTPRTAKATLSLGSGATRIGLNIRFVVTSLNFG